MFRFVLRDVRSERGEASEKGGAEGWGQKMRISGGGMEDGGREGSGREGKRKERSDEVHLVCV